MKKVCHDDQKKKSLLHISWLVRLWLIHAQMPLGPATDSAIWQHPLLVYLQSDAKQHVVSERKCQIFITKLDQEHLPVG